MYLTDASALRFVVAGYPPVLPVARLDGYLASALGAETNLVRIRHGYALKMLYKHGIGPDGILSAREAIQLGRAILDRQGHLTFMYFDSTRLGCWIQVSIKTASGGSELWICTLHRQRESEVDRMSRRHGVLRDFR